MEAAGQFQELKLTGSYRSDEYGVSSVVFDLQEDLLWAATYGGHVTSFLGAELERYTAFQAHTSDIRQLLSVPGGLLSITADELRYTTRTGLPLYTISNEPQLTEMHCLLYLGEEALLVGCQTNQITTFCLTTATVTSETQTPEGICLLKATDQCICSADVSGQVYVHAPDSLEVVAQFTAHTAGMCDMDVAGYYLVTCGLTEQYGQMCVDCQLKVFDLRALRPLPPSPVTMLQPLLVKCLPSWGNTVLVLSQLGEFQFLDLRGLVTPSTMILHHLSTAADGALACSMDISPSCQCLAFGDSTGVIHLWSDRDQPVLNPYSQPSILPDEQDHLLPYISFDDTDPSNAPLSAIPLPASHGPLLSDWPKANSKVTRRRAPSIHPDILDNIKMIQFVGHAPKPAALRRNQVPYNLELDSGNQVPESPMMRESNPLSLIPKPYRQVEIKYSKLGIESFDFGHYNSTRFAGLEIHIPNAYCNSMLQVLYFLEPMRSAMQNHLCDREFCLSCELGFLFLMLDSSDGRSCQAKNFLRAFRTLREASALGLLISREEDERKANLSKLIQSWNSFVLQQTNQETQPPAPPPGSPGGGAEREKSVIQHLFGAEVESTTECRCGWRSSRRTTELLFSLTYPTTNSRGSTSSTDAPPTEKLDFTSVLRESICRQQRAHAWCDQCSKYKSATHRKSLRSLPHVLSLNCSIESEEEREIWRAQQSLRAASWVPLYIELNLQGGEDLDIREVGGVEEAPSGSGSVMYDLSMVVGHVREPWMDTPGNLIAHIRVTPSYHKMKELHSPASSPPLDEPTSQWYLFNDFAITPINEQEAAIFPLEWLTPCILVYTQRDYTSHFDTTISCPLDPSVLLAETHQPRPVQSPATFTPLGIHELPKRGDLVGLDAEFVTLNQEEAELKSDGTHTTLKPSQLSVARITVVRGKTAMEGRPFIDDYIATSEQVVDYLTKFSGIKPGDLDASMSAKHLTTLKAAYLKLLFLLERGVIFVGHGLKKDFRVINILVPPRHVVDTVELFHLPKQRFISLKFLAWFYLGLRIQEGAHNSAEDAWTAVLLYRKFKVLEASQDTTESLRKLYEMGRNLGWQIPDSQPHSTNPPVP